MTKTKIEGVEVEQPPQLRAYQVNLSKGDPLPCDEDELPNIVLALKTGSPCKIRSGIFNPSYYVSLTLDKKRIEEVARYNFEMYEANVTSARYSSDKAQIPYKGLTPVADIFEGMDFSTGGRRQDPKLGEAKKIIKKSALPPEEGHYAPIKSKPGDK